MKRCPLLGGSCNYTPVLIGSCPNQGACTKLAMQFPPRQEIKADGSAH